MSDRSRFPANVLTEQEAIGAKCFQPGETFVEVAREEIEQSIPERCEKIARRCSQRVAVASAKDELADHAMERIANRIAHVICRRKAR